MPRGDEVADRNFANGLGRRAAPGNCADCGRVLVDPTALVCMTCREKPENQTDAFTARERGHRDRVSQYFAHGG